MMEKKQQKIAAILDEEQKQRDFKAKPVSQSSKLYRTFLFTLALKCCEKHAVLINLINSPKNFTITVMVLVQHSRVPLTGRWIMGAPVFCSVIK